MSRIPAIAPAAAEGKTRDLLDAVHKKLGVTPNMTKTLAHSPAALESYLQFSGALAGGVLDAKVRERIALTVAEANQCEYCLSAHTAIGGKLGLPAIEINNARAATSENAKITAALAFAKKVNNERGIVSDADLTHVRAAEISDAEIVEIVANVALNIFTNYINHVAKTEIDFPAVAPLSARR